MCGVKKAFLAITFATCACVSCASDSLAESDAASTAWYAGAAGGVMLPGNGNSLRRAAEIRLRGGCYFSEFFAFELEGSCVPFAASDHGGGTTLSGVAAQGLLHFSGWDAYDRLFGCERFDPFVTFGAMSRFAGRHVFADASHRTAIGPVCGVGAFYHLTDSWSLRADATAQLCCDSPCGMLYGVSIGLQYGFGGGE